MFYMNCCYNLFSWKQPYLLTSESLYYIHIITGRSRSVFEGTSSMGESKAKFTLYMQDSLLRRHKNHTIKGFCSHHNLFSWKQPYLLTSESLYYIHIITGRSRSVFEGTSSMGESKAKFTLYMQDSLLRRHKNHTIKGFCSHQEGMM